LLSFDIPPILKQAILEEICRDVSSAYGDKLILDEELNTFFNGTLKDVIKNLEKEGINVQTYSASLVVMETQRLQIRKFIRDDLSDLYTIMRKPEVMYAWEHGFTKSETRKWLNRQLTRYKKDGYGYFAVVLKNTDNLIGQVGVFKSMIHEKEVVELGYIFDNLYWNQGYCIEAVNACVRFAFDKVKPDKLYCSIRPNNIPSIRIAEKIGMKIIGEHIVNYRDQDMLHNVYILENAKDEYGKTIGR
jgi:RimJ/RimL family protein N-acetyltransferase